MDELNYGRMMHRAMQGLMAEALSVVAEHGLPGDHHFYITFLTGHPGVDMPEWVRAAYAKAENDELVIVLQHEFSDLLVTQDRFSVRLSFNNRPATIVVPFDAVLQFADPSAEFGLRFDPSNVEELDEDDQDDDAAEDEAGSRDEADARPHDAEGEPESLDDEDGRGEVVQLSEFRDKKKK